MKKQQNRQALFKACRFYGWGRWIRTTGMADSESAAVPLGDTPLFICDVIYYSTVIKKVKHYFYECAEKGARHENGFLL